MFTTLKTIRYSLAYKSVNDDSKNDLLEKETDGTYLGFLNNSPDHWAQGENLIDLKVHLRDLYHEFSKGDLPGIRQEIELDLA